MLRCRSRSISGALFGVTDMSTIRGRAQHPGLTVAVIAAAAVLCSPVAHGLTTDEILNYKGPDRQRVLEEGARREGTVVIYSGMIVNQLLRPLTEAFEKKYPFIKARYLRADGN